MDKWKKTFDKNDFIKIDENVKRQSIEKLAIEFQKIEIPKKENYFQKVKQYAPFMNKTTFLIQFILLLIGIFIIKSMTFEKTRLILSTVMPVLAFLQIMELEKSFKYHMCEIEMSCKMNLKELISIKLIINTGINLCIMTILASLTGIHFEQESCALIIYFLVPFMITNVANIGLIRLFKNKSNEIISIVTMLFTNLGLLIIDVKFPNAYETSSILVWIILLFITLFFVVKMFYNFYKKEENIWNLVLID